MLLLDLLESVFKSVASFSTLISVCACVYFNFNTTWVIAGLFVYLVFDNYKTVKLNKQALVGDAATRESWAILSNFGCVSEKSKSLLVIKRQLYFWG